MHVYFKLESAEIVSAGNLSQNKKAWGMLMRDGTSSVDIIIRLDQGIKRAAASNNKIISLHYTRITSLQHIDLWQKNLLM